MLRGWSCCLFSFLFCFFLFLFGGGFCMSGVLGELREHTKGHCLDGSVVFFFSRKSIDLFCLAVRCNTQISQLRYFWFDNLLRR